jgi:hypothetical protein
LTNDLIEIAAVAAIVSTAVAVITLIHSIGERGRGSADGRPEEGGKRGSPRDRRRAF